ncbi:MAG: hypothetical protein ABR538_16030 [Candidatus Binatia bacterium]
MHAALPIRTSRTSRTPRRRRWAAVVVVLALLLAAWRPLQKTATHGMTWDEHLELQSLGAHMDLAASAGGQAPAPVLRDFRGHLEYYGIVNKLPGLLLWRTAQHFAPGPAATGWRFDRTALAAFHASAIAFGLLTAWACRGLARAWPGGGVAPLAAPLLLLLYPRFVGHAFFNLKDVPFAAVYTLLTWQMIAAVLSTRPAAARRATAFAVLLGGALAAMKAPGVAALWPLLPAALLAGRSTAIASPGAGLRIAWLLAPLLALGIAVAATPAAWSSPLQWTLGALGMFGSHPYDRCTVTWGECLAAGDTPADYLLRWFVVTTPLTFLFLFGSGVVELLRRPVAGEKGAPGAAPARSPAGAAIVAAQMLTLPLVAVVSGAALYDTERHVLFVVPAACVVAAAGLQSLLRCSGSWSAGPRRLMLGVLAVGAATTLIDGWRLHPYQYSYFNEVGRHLDPDRNFETDFWGFSLGELVRRHAATQPDPAAWGPLPFVAMPNTVYPFTPTLPANYRKTVEVVTAGGQSRPRVRSTTLVFAINRFEWREPPAECRVVDVEERRLLFADKPMVMGRTLVCEAPGGKDLLPP